MNKTSLLTSKKFFNKPNLICFVNLRTLTLPTISIVAPLILLNFLDFIIY